MFNLFTAIAAIWITRVNRASGIYRGRRIGGVVLLLLSLLPLLIPGNAAGGTVSAEFDPFALALDQLNARFAVVQTEVNRLNGLGQTANANQLQSQLQHFKDELSGSAASNVAAPEVDVVAIYGIPNGSASVHVQATGRPIILALDAYHTTNWSIQVDAGAQIQKVILAGHNSPQTITGLSASVPVVKTTIDNLLQEFDYFEYPRAAGALFATTGIPITTNLSSYNAPASAFQVGPANADWKAQRILAEMDPLYKQATAFKLGQQLALANDYQFKAIVAAPGVPGNPAATALIQSSPVTGNINTLRTLSGAVNKIAVAPDGTIYGIAGSNIDRINPATGVITPMALPASGLGSYDYMTGIAFDTLRNRLVVSSLEGEGSLYSYSPATNTWGVLASTNDVDLWAFSYFAANDSFYGIANNGGDYTGIRQLLRYSGTGQFLGAIDLSQLIPVGTAFDRGYQLIPTGNRLELITPPVADLYNPQLALAPLSFLINPLNGQVEYLGAVGVTVPTPPAVAGLGLLGLIWLAAIKRRRLFRA